MLYDEFVSDIKSVINHLHREGRFMKIRKNESMIRNVCNSIGGH